MKKLSSTIAAAVLTGWAAMPSSASACTYSHDCLAPAAGYENLYNAQPATQAANPDVAVPAAASQGTNALDPAIKPETGLWGPHGSQWSYD